MNGKIAFKIKKKINLYFLLDGKEPLVMYLQIKNLDECKNEKRVKIHTQTCQKTGMKALMQ